VGYAELQEETSMPKQQRTLMGTEVHVLFSDVKEARQFAEEATKRRSVVRVGLVRPVVRRRPTNGIVSVEVDDYNKHEQAL
jgi:hypothetical protein